MRHFHSYGPVNPAFHFAAPRPELVAHCVAQLVGEPGEGGHFFTMWAARQTGKTWLMRRAIAEIRAQHGDRFTIGHLTLQGTLDEHDTEQVFFRAVPSLLREGFDLDVPAPASWDDWKRMFARTGGAFDRPLILLLDEFDSLPAPIIDRLVSMFRVMSLDREAHILHGLALIGVRAVLGLDSARGSPFNVQRSLHVPNLTRDEVGDLFAQYQAESGQEVTVDVIDAVFRATRGQPGLVGWFGELLTETYNPEPKAPILLAQWEHAYGAACQVEPNNTVLNLVKKARGPYREHALRLFTRADVNFSFEQEWCNFLYLNGIIDYEDVTDDVRQRTRVCRFSSPFIQLRLYRAFTDEMFDNGFPALALDPLDRLTDVFAGPTVDAAALLGRYRAYLGRVKQKGLDPWRAQPRRADMHLTEAVGHFHLYAWLREALGRLCAVSPEFPTGNGKVDLCLQAGTKRGIIEVKSFVSTRALDEGREQAARYAKKLGLAEAAICVFVPVHDEGVLAALSGTEVIEGVTVTVVAVGWG